MTIELSITLLHILHERQPRSAALALIMQFAYALKHCSVRFIICGTALKFSASIYYVETSLFFFFKKKIKIFYICYLNDL